jgi:hypothetical protein
LGAVRDEVKKERRNYDVTTSAIGAACGHGEKEFRLLFVRVRHPVHVNVNDICSNTGSKARDTENDTVRFQNVSL